MEVEETNSPFGEEDKEAAKQNDVSIPLTAYSAQSLQDVKMQKHIKFLSEQLNLQKKRADQNQKALKMFLHVAQLALKQAHAQIESKDQEVKKLSEINNVLNKTNEQLNASLKQAHGQIESKDQKIKKLNASLKHIEPQSKVDEEEIKISDGKNAINIAKMLPLWKQNNILIRINQDFEAVIKDKNFNAMNKYLKLENMEINDYISKKIKSVDFLTSYNKPNSGLYYEKDVKLITTINREEETYTIKNGCKGHQYFSITFSFSKFDLSNFYWYSEEGFWSGKKLCFKGVAVANDAYLWQGFAYDYANKKCRAGVRNKTCNYSDVYNEKALYEGKTVGITGAALVGGPDRGLICYNQRLVDFLTTLHQTGPELLSEPTMQLGANSVL